MRTNATLVRHEVPGEGLFPLAVCDMAYRSGGPKVLVIVLAGGEGKRLMPLTADRAKPAVPFGGIYRLIDFALSNVVNSGYLKIVVLTQYKSHSLDRHVTGPGACRRCSATTWPPSRPSSASTSPGTRAAPTRSSRASTPSPTRSPTSSSSSVPTTSTAWTSRQMVDQHVETGAGVTVAAIRQPIEMADQFGVIEVDPDDPTKIRAFREKPTDPKGLPDSPGRDPREHGQLRLRRRRPRRRRDRRDPSTGAARHGRRHRPGPRRAGTRPTPTTSRTTSSPAAPSATWATGATSGRWTPTTTPTWTSSRSTRLQPLQLSTGRSTRRLRALPAGEVRPRPPRPLR
jgi:hypothetical protein